jgi:phospholipid-binding lipoprotein MlaA
MTKQISILTLLMAFTLLTGCASINSPKADPFEGLNRATFKVNETVDDYLLKPVAKGYQAVTPGFVRSGVSNAFSNIGDVGTSVNNLLQGKPSNAISDVSRFLVNSTLGVLGLFDVATTMGLEKHDEDFGQTLGRWGLDSGPYLVLPLLGPSTVRDAVSKVADSYTGYARYIQHVPTRNSTQALGIINLRADLLNTTSTLDEASLDKYQFIRDAYLQRRLSQVYDGKVPQAKRDQLEDDMDVSDSAKAGGKAGEKAIEKSTEKSTEKVETTPTKPTVPDAAITKETDKK